MDTFENVFIGFISFAEIPKDSKQQVTVLML